ncbi:helix-turn-helix domain-containing protein [Chelatococcus asaccharovorans]|uniref:helix-turn-helix domain-containing protein n=1 Tax=Chelatococcus asaccharovorans TaxID=28210 RepID=UPI00224C6B1E|nr:helix-turn-helix domain-containing protein [Chelatococcus asaccharovorans]CAH1649750.1 hypothetical protein CHELA40_10268 [Chelatococcus asaccharovorans]CAH1686908.1 hypothetical protein CHELA17_65342 [Chelatococcus asaccharovorans]
MDEGCREHPEGEADPDSSFASSSRACWRLTVAIVKDQSLIPSAKVVFILLLSHLSLKTGECFPSADRLAELADMSRSRILALIGMLEAARWIEVTRVPGVPNKYRFPMPTSRANATTTRRIETTSRTHATGHASAAGSGEKPNDFNTSRTDATGRIGKTLTTEEDSLKAISSSTADGGPPRDARPAPDIFAAFRAVYPVGGARGEFDQPVWDAARRAFEAAVASGTAADIIVDAARKFGAKTLREVDADPTKIKWVPLPSNWISRRKWEGSKRSAPAFSADAAKGATIDRETAVRRLLVQGKITTEEAAMALGEVRLHVSQG